MLGDRTSTRSWHCKTRLTRLASCAEILPPQLFLFATAFGERRPFPRSRTFGKILEGFSTCFSKKKEKAEKQPAAGTRGSEGGEETVGSENSSSGSTRLLEQPKKKQKKVEKTLESTDLTPKKKTPRCVPLPLSRSHGARVPPPPAPPEPLQTIQTEPGQPD